MNERTHQVVDWSTLLEQLRNREVRTGTISEHTGIAVSTLREYRGGVKSPLHANGEAIIRFWCSVTGKQREEIPMTAALPSGHRR